MAWKQKYTVKDGTSRYRVGYRDDAGRKHFKSFLRSKDADAYMLEVTRRAQLGHLWQDTPITFGEFAGVEVNEKDYVRLTGDGWFERYRPTVRQSSFDRRKDVIRHLRPMLDVRLDKLTPSLVQDTVLGVHKDSPRQARMLHDTVKMIVRNAAVRGQVVQPGVLTLAPPPEGAKRAPQALTRDEIERLASASTEPHLIRTAAYTGLRQGELFALRDCDIDLKAATITVRGIIYDGQRYEHTKTKAGMRTINVAPQVVTELKRQLLKRKQGVELVFPTVRGKAWLTQNFDHRFKVWREAAGLTCVFHDLRHTFASLMVQTGVHPKVLQEMLGHTNFNITMTLYTHLADGQRKDAAAGLGALLAGEA